jgi:hypothetical protein
MSEMIPSMNFLLHLKKEVVSPAVFNHPGTPGARPTVTISKSLSLANASALARRSS